MKKFLIIFAVCVAIFVGSMYLTANEEYPQLQDGDLIFQTSKSNQSSAILIATADPFTHMGIIKNKGNDIVVIEAAGKVKEAPFKDWVARGVLGRVAIYRAPELTQKQSQKILSSAKALYGRPYDIFFSFKNDAIYCSELPYLAYKSVGIPIGKVQKISELNFDNALVKKLIEKRWQGHSECKAKKYNFEECYQYILRQDLVTPASVASDVNFQKIYSNYPL